MCVIYLLAKSIKFIFFPAVFMEHIVISFLEMPRIKGVKFRMTYTANTIT